MCKLVFTYVYLALFWQQVDSGMQYPPSGHWTGWSGSEFSAGVAGKLTLFMMELWDLSIDMS